MAKSDPKYPIFDPEKDGNYFVWVLQTSARMRKENINGQGGSFNPLRIDPLTGVIGKQIK